MIMKFPVSSSQLPVKARIFWELITGNWEPEVNMKRKIILILLCVLCVSAVNGYS